MSLLGLSLLLAAADYPADPILTEFKSRCVEQTSFGSAAATAKTNGWSPSQLKEGTKAAVAVGAGKRMLTELGAAPTIVAFSKTVGGRSLDLILTSARVPFDGQPQTMTNCNIYDFEATANIDRATLRAWAGRDPAESVVEGGPVSEWAPGLSARPSKTRVSFTPTTTTGNVRRIGGLVLSSTIVEETN